MTMKKKPDDEQLWFDQHVAPDLEAFDEAMGGETPDLREMESFVLEHQSKVRGKQWRELALFWLCSLMLLSGMYVLAQDGWLAIAVLQLVSAIGAAIYLLVKPAARKGSSWKSK